LKQEAVYTEALLQTHKQTKQGLYNSYAGMLLGYIFRVVKGNDVAEQYLVEIFNALQPEDIDEMTQPGVNTYCRLQQLARKKLSVNNNDGSVATNNAAQSNKYIDLMNPDQRLVFCGVHYQGKTTAKLAIELNRSETIIRQLLKESFTIIRNNP
jgi:hypothetical protein